MRIFIFAISLFCLSSFSLFAQNYSIKGTVIDTASAIALQNTSIAVLNSNDSTLVKFTRAGVNGSFSLTDLWEGKFILLVSYSDYADYVEHFSLDPAKSTLNFGNIKMILKAKLLAEVIIKGTSVAIKIKGDTTEFKAAAFTIQPNSKVEDLIKQFPGIQVDQNGRITAQGQTVTKVLVDGEEFFGDDPTLVTRNIRSDMVDKVQLYDKKSDQATFTGIDDGERTKTMNIKLKEDKKQGYFGKADTGTGSDKYYQGQVMFNHFSAVRKLSLFGNLGNTGKTGLNLQDSRKYGTLSMGSAEGGSLMLISTATDDLEAYNGTYGGEGIPVTRSGGVHYDTKWDDNKQSFNLNYKIGSIDVEGIKNALNQNNLPSGLINSRSDQEFNNYMFRQKVDVIYLTKLSPTSDLRVSADGTLRTSKVQNKYISLSQRKNNSLLNQGDRSLTNDNTQKLFNTSILWTKKLKTPGRTLSLSFRHTSDENDSEGFLNTRNSFYSTQGLLDSLQLVDQFKKNGLNSNAISSNLTYTEPISKTFSVVINYGAGINNSRSDRRSFNQSGSGLYDVLDAGFSNNFKLYQTYHQPGAFFNYRRKKTVLNFGTRLGLVNFKQTDLFNANKYKRNFENWTPQVSYQYTFSPERFIRLNYNGSTILPNFDQLQPVRINTDPLNITIGNPVLSPSFTNGINLTYNAYKVISNQAIYFNGSYSQTSNPIVSNTITDNAGKSIFQSANLTNKRPASYNLTSYFTQKIKDTNIELGMDVGSRGNSYYNMVNSVLNKTNYIVHMARLTASYIRQQKAEISFEFGPEYNIVESVLQPDINNNGWGVNSRLQFSIYFPGKVQVSSDINYLYRERTSSFDQDFDRLIVNSTLSKKFLKAENLKFSLSGNDLLNQNTGFSRYAISNMIIQNSYTTVKRYMLFSLVYDFNYMGGVNKK